MQWFPEGFYSICTLSYENIVCTMIYKKFLKFAPPHVLCGHASCALISDSCQVNYISWGSAISNFRLIGPELRPQWKIEIPKSRNFLFLRKTISVSKVTDLQPGEIFCIKKKISLLIYHFFRDWFFSFFRFLQFLCKFVTFIVAHHFLRFLWFFLKFSVWAT